MSKKSKRENDPRKRQRVAVELGSYAIPGALDHYHCGPEELTLGEFEKTIQRSHRKLDRQHARVQQAAKKRLPGGRIRVAFAHGTMRVYQERLETPQERDKRLRDIERVNAREMEHMQDQFRARMRHFQRRNPEAFRAALEEFVEK